ncbi:putative Flagellin A [Desulfamplus magnetovallimortis]|uniref:Flagellin n=1 Tax=Desulfamplus magnetovallimortis TaxID=1246637 RepID=A0A1W1HAX2_9BACT|nr:flagellin [Desulfamplus magnetovallimortis]SLM29630.1 putative Flagellin A [Desulfamplus magnetovallimortis]
MSLSIKTNIASLNAYQKLSKNSNRLNGSLQKLSSGLRINKACDDGSGMVIADSLKSQYRGLGQAIKNANDAVSITQTADGALEESINIVNIIKTKAIQASQDGQTYESRKAIQSDIDKLRQELDQIAKSTSFNGQKLLSGEFTNKTFHIGAYTGETVDISIDSAESTKIGHTTVAEVIPDYTKLIYTTLQDKQTGDDIVIEPFKIEYYTPDLVKDELDKLTKEDINKLTDEELAKRTNKDLSKLTTREIEELRNIFIDEIVENASDQLTKNVSNRLVKHGLGTLAEQINKYEEKTDVKAFPIVESESRIIAGSTSDNFKINGITIGNIDVIPNDSDGALIAAINSLSNMTGVKAHVTASGKLELVSTDGRAIKVEGLPTPEVISSSALTTHGYLKMISRNFGQYDVTHRNIAENVATATTANPTIMNAIPTNTIINWSSNTQGSGGGINATITSGAVNIGTETLLDDPNFISNFSSNLSVLEYGANSVTTVINFSSPLPTGSKLLLGDVDSGHVATLTSGGTPLTYVSQLESRSGQNSTFPIYNPATGKLTSQPNSNNNDEVTSFDLSNLSSLQIEFQGSGAAWAAIALADPSTSITSTITTTTEYQTYEDSIVFNKELLRLCDVNVTTFDDAQISMELADISLGDLDKIRSNIGSVQNQLQSTISNITNTQNNAMASESSIRDLDFSSESMYFSKLQVFAESGAFVLAQANSSKENLISLLEG